MGDKVLLFKAALGCGGAILMVILWLWQLPLRISQRQFTIGYLSLTILSRVLIFIVLFGAMHLQVQSDVPLGYYPQGKAVIAGQIPYRDFECSYGPLFPYLVAVPLKFWDSPKAIVLLTIVLEALSLPVWLAVGRKVVSESTVRYAAMFYACSSLTLLNNAIDGQNQVWLSCLLALACWLALQRQSALSGAMTAGTIIVVKVLGVLVAPGVFLLSRKRLSWSVAFYALPAIVLGFFASRGGNVAQPLLNEGKLISSGNIPYMLTGLGFPTTGLIGLIPALVLAVSLCAICAAAILPRLRRAESDDKIAIHLMTLIGMTFMIVSRKSFTTYLCIFYFPLAFTVAARGVGFAKILLMSALQFIAVLEPSLFFRWMKVTGITAALSMGVSHTLVAIFIVINLALIACYVWIWVEAWGLTFPGGKTHVSNNPNEFPGSSLAT